MARVKVRSASSLASQSRFVTQAHQEIAFVDLHHLGGMPVVGGHAVVARVFGRLMAARTTGLFRRRSKGRFLLRTGGAGT